ncbi:MAG TPA: CGNR zinc finger domain-containing protein [Thermoleophilaceae bacterium]|nr:CGNR zinc finger domain-containing protein [Thermoleophilaceae bacterium]
MLRRPDPPWDPTDLPLIGQPFAVELANTDYRSGSGDVDYLAEPGGVAAWFAHVPAATGIKVPLPVTAEAAGAIRGVRDATRLLLTELADRTPSRSAAAAATLHDASRSALARLALDVESSPPEWELRFDGAEPDVLVSSVAARCILFLGGSDAERVSRCARPDCPLLYVRDHGARRFCSEVCAHRVRQARYDRSRRAPED